MLTVNSSRPARNSRVPSSGSTLRKRPPSPSTGRLPVASSATTGTPGMRLPRARVCHDPLSQVGGIGNGVEGMEEGRDEETSKFGLDLIKKRGRTAPAKLHSCRIASGAAGSAGAQIGTGDAEKVTRGLMED